MIEALQLEADGQYEWLVQRRHQIDLLELEWSMVGADYCGTDDFDRRGFTTPIDSLRIGCHMTGPAVADRVAVGERLGDLPESTDAMCLGAIGFGHMVLMSRTANALAGSKTAAPFDERDLLDKARENTVGKFHQICLHARHAADPAGVAR